MESVFEQVLTGTLFFLQAVWFGCDVGKYNSIKPDGILDLKA